LSTHTAAKMTRWWARNWLELRQKTLLFSDSCYGENLYFSQNCARLNFFQSILDYSLQATPLYCAQIRVLSRIPPILPHNIAHFFAPNSLVVSKNPDLSLRHFFFVCFMSREWRRILVSGLLLRAEIKIDLISILNGYNIIMSLLSSLLSYLCCSTLDFICRHSSHPISP
jgi:hypothetical protein